MWSVLYMYVCAHVYVTEVVISFYLTHTAITNQYIPLAAEYAGVTLLTDP